MKYIGAKFTIDETFNVTATPFSRNETSDDITPDITYYSISGTGVVYGSEDYAKKQAIIDAGILNVVYYDPDVYPSHVNILNDNDWYTGSDYLYALSTIDGVLGRELTKKTETSTTVKIYAPGEAYHKIQRTIQTTLPVDYDQLRVDDENANTSVHSTTLSGSGGSYEYVVYDMFSSGYSSLASFNLSSRYRPLKNGQLNVLCDQDFSITVHTEHTIIFGMSDSNYEIYKPVMADWIDIYPVWFTDGDAPFIDTMPKLIESSPDPNSAWVTVNQWDEKTWSGLSSHDGIDMWSDGTNFYYSNGYNQYVLDKTTETWSPKTWTGLTSFNGRYIWTDGTDIYYSNGKTQYVLDPSTSTWSSKSWTGLRNFYGSYVWKSETGGIYYSNASDQYVLNKSENKWVKKTWSGVSQPGGVYIWTDGVNTYYSKTTAQYVLNPSTSTWSVKRWTGLTNFYGQYIWSDGDNIYYSKGSEQYVLDKETYTWIPKTWPGLTSFNGQYVWTYDDNNMYYSYGSDQYELHYRIPYRLSYLDMNESENIGNEWVIDNDIPYRVQYPELIESLDFSDIWLIDNDIPYRYEYPELKESFNVGGEWLTKDEPDTSSTKKYLKFTHTVTATFTAGNRVPVVTHDLPDSTYKTIPTHYSYGIWNYIYGRIWVPSQTKVLRESWEFSNNYIYSVMNTDYANYFMDVDLYNKTSVEPESDILHYDSPVYEGGSYWPYPSQEYGVGYYLEPKLVMQSQLTPSESGSTTITFSHIFEFDSDNEDYRAFIEAFPNNVEPWYPMVKAVPFHLGFPELHKSLPGGDIWLIDDEYPYRVDFPALKTSAGAFTGWLQNTGYSPYRPWPNHKTIFQSAEPIEIPEIDWTKGMQQTFEYFKVDPNTWNDYEQITTVISSNITKDTDSEMRGHASIETSEALDECYIRTYMVIRQNSIKQRVCLGTHLYMVQSDSFNGMRHQYNYTGYTPLVELREKLIPLGYSVVGVTGEVNGKVAPMLSDEIAQLISQNSRVKLENRVKVEEPLLNNFVAGTTDNILTVVNNLLNASSLQQYQVTVDEFGTVCIKEAISVYNERHVFEYTDDNSSILMADINLASDLSSIPNVLEVIYAGDANKDIGAVRVVVRNEDPNSVVSTVSRGREVWSRVVISNIGSPYDKSEITRQAVVDQVTNQAYRLLEDASTIRKTIQYEHGYCDVEIGDTVLFNYKRAGLIGIKAKVVSQTITCKPGCKVSEMAVYTKKLWNRGV